MNADREDREEGETTDERGNTREDSEEMDGREREREDKEDVTKGCTLGLGLGRADTEEWGKVEVEVSGTVLEKLGLGIVE